MMACGESDWQYARSHARTQRPRTYSNADESDDDIGMSIRPFYSKLLQLLFMSFASASAYRWVFLLFLFFSFSHSLIPLTSRLRINYISIDWPLEGGIDIHGPPSAPRPMCIPQYRAPAFCITPGLHYLLYFLGSQVFTSEPGLPGSPHPHWRTGCAKIRRKPPLRKI